ncbi:MAG: choice-of-anchor J domain-containing protein [Sphingomonadales bacterium]
MKFYFPLLVAFFVSQLQAQTTLLQTDFQTGIPSNYTLLNLDNQAPDPLVVEFASGWITAPDPENTSDTVAAVSSYFETADTANRWLITPALQMGGFGNFISWQAKSHDPSFPDDYLVLVSHTTNDPSAFTDTIGSVQEENFEWTFREVNLSDKGYNDSTIYIAFVLRTVDGFKLYIDDIEVRKDDPAGLLETPFFEMVVYPNPSTDFISIQNIQNISRIEILDLNGKVLLYSYQSSISVAELLSGSYLLRCTTPNGIYTKPILKL